MIGEDDDGDDESMIFVDCGTSNSIEFVENQIPFGHIR